MTRLILQNIVESIDFHSLPSSWQDFDFENFSRNKKLYKFQKKALESALKVLYKYYEEFKNFEEGEDLDVNNERKKELWKEYILEEKNLEKYFVYDLEKLRKHELKHLLSEYFDIENEKVSSEHVVNRAGFWMATGSGKTLVIIKLIEFLRALMRNGEIPKYDVLFLTYRDDLIKQFKEHLKEYNDWKSSDKIDVFDLKDYENVKRNKYLFESGSNVFYYRADNISTESKEKLIDFRDYDNEGRWFIILDEAHKGDSEESKRQIIYSILSRNGFLFNFSATFTEYLDQITTCFEFKLDTFINEGYGKKIYLFEKQIEAFRNRDELSENEKFIVILESLILNSYIYKFLERVRNIRNDMYHKPLIMVLVHTVNKVGKKEEVDPDLEIFFRKIGEIAKGEFDKKLIDKAKEELRRLFQENKEIMFVDDEMEIDFEILNSITFEDILNYCFNSSVPGTIEAIKRPTDRKEIAFKLKTSDKAFALIKIGDITRWEKEVLRDYDIIGSFEDESFFENLNKEDSDIKLLLGSRAFYEGWDSNRPNIILFINIGGREAKKFTLQAIGRGVRIEPVKNKRKRLVVLRKEGEIENELYEKIKNDVDPLETLFVLGTHKKALEETLESLKSLKEWESVGKYFEVNSDIKNYKILIPVYNETSIKLFEEKDPSKFVLSEKSYNLLKNYVNYLEDDRVILMYHNIPDLRVLEFVKSKVLEKDCDRYIRFDDEYDYKNHMSLFDKILKYFSLNLKQFERFKEIEDEIVHFREIKFRGDKIKEFIEKVEQVKNYKAIKKELESKGVDKNIIKQTLFGAKKQEFDSIKIEYILNHYYLPVVLSEEEKIDYLNHIIKVKSEVKFIESLEEYLEKENNLFKEFDLWFFSKIDQTVDKVYIPYYDPEKHKITDGHPDFIFWLCKENNYYIVFIDPKTNKRSEYEHKVDSYKKIFENKEFDYDRYKIKVFLYLRTEDENKVAEGYRKYWFDNIDEVLKRLLEASK